MTVDQAPRSTAPSGPGRSRRGRIVAFAVVCVLCVVGAGLAISRSSGDTATVTDGGASGSGSTVAPTVRRGLDGVYVDTRLGPTYGRVVVADPATTEPTVAASGLTCDRVDMAADRGICLRSDRGVTTTYQAVVFDDRFRTLSTFDLPGIPSRTRVAPDGSKGAWTTFVSGDSYASHAFSTRTHLVDLRSGEAIGDLETFTALKDGQPFAAVDFNYWGVTFAAADANRFYATLGTGGHTYLVQGDLARRTVTVLRDLVECPSLSPDGTRIAYKKRVTGDFGRVEWRLAVLDLTTLVDHELTETRNVDDQAAWLDDTTVVYGLPEAESGTPTKDTWAVPADGSGAPRLLVKGAWSFEPSRP